MSKRRTLENLMLPPPPFALRRVRGSDPLPPQAA